MRKKKETWEGKKKKRREANYVVRKKFARQGQARAHPLPQGNNNFARQSHPVNDGGLSNQVQGRELAERALLRSGTAKKKKKRNEI